MAATIVTVAKIGDFGTSVVIKVNGGHSVPSRILTNINPNSKAWGKKDMHIFIWTNDKGQERSMIVSFASIGWLISSVQQDENVQRFLIDAPFNVLVPEQGPPA